MTVIPVRYGLEILIFVYLIFLFICIVAFENPNTLGIITLTAMILFTNYAVFGIKYSIDNENLYIKNSIFGTTTVPIATIKTVEKTQSILSSPAPSIFGRVRILSKAHDIIISPRHYDEFKNLLLSINPEIVFKN